MMLKLDGALQLLSIHLHHAALGLMSLINAIGPILTKDFPPADDLSAMRQSIV
jgi:hypothetical protein